MKQRGWEGLPDLSKTLYQQTYFHEGEDYDKWVQKIAHKYSNDAAHGERIAKYISNYWYHPSTPVSADRGLPISCYVSHIDDSREGIFEGYFEGMWLGAEGGGRGVYWGEVGGAGRPMRTPKELLATMTWAAIQEDSGIPKSTGTVPFLGPSDRLTYSISQAGTRRSTEAAYLPITHPDIPSFIDIRLETGDPNRRMPNLHHSIALSDEFMHAKDNLEPWDFICPHTGKVTATVDAYDLWMDILTLRKTETGEPFLLFIDTVNKRKCAEYRALGLEVVSSNICTEIVLHTSPNKTAVCNLGSTNLEFWDEWKDEVDQFMADLSDYHDNINTYFLEETAKYTGMKAEAFRRVRNAVEQERNIGIGTMGWHSLLQKKNIPFESAMAIGLNRTIFHTMRTTLDAYQASLPESAICPMSREAGTHRRNIYQMAVAPTMSISNLCKLASSGIEPWVSNSFTKKLHQGSFVVRNIYLDIAMREYAASNIRDESIEPWMVQQWKSIDKVGGSVQHLSWMDEWTKDVFKTAFEIDQRYIIQQAGDRQDDIDQAQSVNLFLPAECSYEELHTIHNMAWQSGLNSLYYLRSEPETTANVGGGDRKPITLEDDVCVACT